LPPSISLVTPNPPSTVFYSFFKPPATPEIYTLSLHDALPISQQCARHPRVPVRVLVAHRAHPRHRLRGALGDSVRARLAALRGRSEEHTSELQSHLNLVCRLLLEKKKNK